MACAVLWRRQGRRAAPRDVGHRASSATHPVGATRDEPAPPEGSPPTARPLRKRSKSVVPLRSSTFSFRIASPGGFAAR